MERLFIRLYFDEDVSELLAKLVRARGFDVVTTVEAGNLSKSDAEQLEYAAENNLTLLTHNRRHFDELSRQYASAGRTHSGIIIAVRRRPHEILPRLLRILNQVVADEISGQVRYI